MNCFLPFFLSPYLCPGVLIFLRSSTKNGHGGAKQVISALLPHTGVVIVPIVVVVTVVVVVVISMAVFIALVLAVVRWALFTGWSRRSFFRCNENAFTEKQAMRTKERKTATTMSSTTTTTTRATFEI